MEVVKFHTSDIFKREQFAQLLRENMDVRAIAVDGGILLDREAFNSVSPASMPQWAWINRKYINSALHTTPGTAEQQAAIRNCYYVLRIGNSRVLKGSFSDMMNDVVEYGNLVSNLSVVDNVTGKVVYKKGSM